LRLPCHRRIGLSIDLRRFKKSLGCFCWSRSNLVERSRQGMKHEAVRSGPLCVSSKAPMHHGDSASVTNAQESVPAPKAAVACISYFHCGSRKGQQKIPACFAVSASLRIIVGNLVDIGFTIETPRACKYFLLGYFSINKILPILI
jgi:hypothetical protein